MSLGLLTEVIATAFCLASLPASSLPTFQSKKQFLTNYAAVQNGKGFHVASDNLDIP